MRAKDMFKYTSQWFSWLCVHGGWCCFSVIVYGVWRSDLFYFIESSWAMCSMTWECWTTVGNRTLQQARSNPPCLVSTDKAMAMIIMKSGCSMTVFFFLWHTAQTHSRWVNGQSPGSQSNTTTHCTLRSLNYFIKQCNIPLCISGAKEQKDM